MKIRLYSDIHNEISRSYNKSYYKKFGDWVPDDMVGDDDTILVLAGDVDKAKQIPNYLNKLSERFKYVIHVAGNHEYYGYNIRRSNDKMLGEDVPLNDNVYHLNNSSVIIDGVAFIGGTMWTDLSDPLIAYDCQRNMNDYKMIRHGNKDRPYARKLLPSDVTLLHSEWKSFILNELEKYNDLQTVVITHHSPFDPYSMTSGCPPYGVGVKNIDYAYHANQEEIIRKLEPTLWLYGHTHDCIDTKLYNTRIVSNCVGYFNEPKKFNNNIIKLSERL